MCSALKMWLSSHCSVELVSCPAPRPWLLWYNQHCNWWNKQGTSGQGVETADMPSICVSLPSDLGDSLFPASAQTASSWPHAGLYSLGIQQVFSLMAPGDGLEWAEWEVSLPPQGHICFIRFTYWNSSHPCPRQCRGLHPMGPADAPPNLLLWCLCNVLLPGLLHLPARAGPGHPSVLSVSLSLQSLWLLSCRWSKDWAISKAIKNLICV